MMLTILPFLVSSVVSQSMLRTQFLANVRQPAAVSHGRVQNIKAFSGRLNGESGESVPSYVNGAPLSADLGGEVMSDPTLGYQQHTFSRRTLAGILAFGTLAAPVIDTKHSWAAGTDIKLATFGQDAEATGTKHIWDYIKGKRGDPIKGGNLLLKGGGLQGANTKETVPTTEKYIVGNIDGKGFPDVSSCEGISITAKSINILKAPQVNGYTGGLKEFAEVEIPEYKGFTLTIGKLGPKKDSVNPYYKAKFNAPLNTFGIVNIPFKDFTNSFDGATGDPIDSCKASPDNCPDPKTLGNLNQMAFWAETNGIFKLEVQAVSAYGCSAPPQAAELATFDEAGDTSSLWLFAAASLGLLVFFIVRIRTRPALVMPALLG